MTKTSNDSSTNNVFSCIYIRKIRPFPYHGGEWFECDRNGDTRVVRPYDVPADVYKLGMQHLDQDVVIGWGYAEARLLPMTDTVNKILAKVVPRLYKAEDKVMSLEEALRTKEAELISAHQKAVRARREANEDMVPWLIIGGTMTLFALLLVVASVVPSPTDDEPVELDIPEPQVDGSKIIFIMMEGAKQADAATAAA